MATNSMKILAIDDNRDNLTSLKAVLKDALPEATVITSLNGRQGIELAVAEHPDVILLDIVMPGMDGFEVCRKLKADERSRGIPVVFLTAQKTDTQSRIKALEAGGEAFLAKPIDETELTAQVRVMAKIKEVNESQIEEEKRLTTLVAERTHELESSRTAALNLLEDLRAENEARQKTEESLRESEGRYRDLIENLNDIVFQTDFDGVLTYVSPQIRGLLGYEPSEVEGQHFASLVHPEDLDDLTRSFQDVLAGQLHSSDFRIRTKSGDYRWMRSSSKPMRKDGRVLGIQGLATDISEVKKSEEALRASESKYRTLVEHSIQGLVVAQSDPVRLSFVSGPMEEITGYSPKEMRAMSPNELSALIHEEDREAFFRNFQDRLAGKDVPKRSEYRIINKNGGIGWIEISSTVTEYNGKPATQTVFMDITERKALEKGLIEAQKMEAVGTLAGGIAHDFNNLLHIISGHSELLDMELAERELKFGELDAIRQSAHRGADLVKQILTFSRKLDAKFESINLNEEVRGTERLLYRTIPKMIDIELRLEEGLDRVRADSTQIEQMLINLAVNAKDAMPDGGKLTIETQNVILDEDYGPSQEELVPGQYVLLKVSDTGHGMEEDVRQHIFEPFFTTKGLADGTGLGLATAFGIVKMHGGHITCESQIGRGTTFNIYFPAMEPAKSEVVMEQEAPPVAGGTETILVVDDEPMIRELAKRILEKSGYSVLTAGSGKEGIEVYAEHKSGIALVILDLIMPEIGGKQCLEELLKINPQVKALIASGFAVKGDTKTFLDTEAKGIVPKPFNMRKLLRSVRHVLDGM